jgi:hypothetical protein
MDLYKQIKPIYNSLYYPGFIMDFCPQRPTTEHHHTRTGTLEPQPICQPQHPTNKASADNANHQKAQRDEDEGLEPPPFNSRRQFTNRTASNDSDAHKTPHHETVLAMNGADGLEPKKT